jgi:hypothetical protein
MQKIKGFEIINHGYDHSDYFQGCGTYFTDFDMAFTGIGTNAKEAYEDCVDSIAMSGFDVESLPTNPRGINKKDKVPAKLMTEENSIWFYVSIRIKIEE